MSVALCLSGQSRFVHEGYKLLSKNLIGFEDFDIFIHTWKDNQYNKVLDLYNTKDHVIEYQRYNIMLGEVDVDYTQRNAGSGNFVHYSMFYSIWKANDLKSKYESKNNFKYDCVIKSRFDVALFDKINVLDEDLSFINSPDVCGNPKVISDWFNFSSSKNMDLYLDVYNNMQNYKKEGVRMNSGEELLTHHYKKCNLEILKIKKNLCLIRENKTHIPFWISIQELDNFFKLNNI